LAHGQSSHLLPLSLNNQPVSTSYSVFNLESLAHNLTWRAQALLPSEPMVLLLIKNPQKTGNSPQITEAKTKGETDASLSTPNLPKGAGNPAHAGQQTVQVSPLAAHPSAMRPPPQMKQRRPPKLVDHHGGGSVARGRGDAAKRGAMHRHSTSNSQWRDRRRREWRRGNPLQHATPNTEWQQRRRRTRIDSRRHRPPAQTPTLSL